MRTPRLTYGPWGADLDELVAAACDAERAGAATLWVPELHRSATVPAAAIAARTDTAQVGTAITLAFTRSPMVTALEALDLDELSGGRFVLGLGSGVKRLIEDWHNATWGKPVAHLRETVAAIRLIVEQAHTGAPMSLDAEFEPVRVRGYQRPFPPVRARIPVYLAGLGPGMVRLAGRIGDGWISHELCSPDFLRDRVLPGLTGGLADAGRDRADLDVVVSACCVIDPDGARARRVAAGLVGFYASVKTYADFFDFHGLAADQATVLETFRAGADRPGADELGAAVSDRMVDALTIAGTPREVRERIAGYAGLADTIKLTPPTHGVRTASTREYQGRIIELIEELS